MVSYDSIIHVCELCRHKVCREFFVNPIVGASLSEPHTSGTALQKCVYVCLSVCLWPYTVNLNITKIELMLSAYIQ